jgi:adenylosuccinate lyase
VLALNSLLKGLHKLQVNPERLHHDLHQNWAVLAEPIQTILRREGFPKPYEALKELTRGQHIDQQSLHRFIEGLAIPDAIKADLKALTPEGYTGNAAHWAEHLA